METVTVSPKYQVVITRSSRAPNKVRPNTHQGVLRFPITHSRRLFASPVGPAAVVGFAAHSGTTPECGQASRCAVSPTTALLGGNQWPPRFLSYPGVRRPQ